MNARRYRRLFPLVATVALVAFLFGYVVWPAEPLQRKLDLVTIGMTQDEVEEILGAPTVLTEWKAPEWEQWRDMDVLAFQGRTGIAEMQIAHDTRRVIHKGWSPSQPESGWRRVWRWARGER